MITNDMDLERATSMLNALPSMSKTIVDDTLYEKVLSYLTLVFSTQSDLSLLRPHLLANIQSACHKDDYRVTALAIRILGQWVFYTRHFDDAEPLLSVIGDGLTSSEAALRCACLEACRMFLSCEIEWPCQLSPKFNAALLDQSSYVVKEACLLFSTVVETNVINKMDPCELILSLLHPQADQKQILAALDFCWECCQKEKGIEYIKSRKLFYPLIPLLLVANRMIRSRILEILSKLFSRDTNTLETLGLGHDSKQAFTVISRMAIDMMKEATVIDELLTGISFLNTSFILLKDASWHDSFQTLYDLYTLCLDKSNKTQFEQVPFMIRTSRAKNNVLQLVIRTVDTLLIKDHSITQETRFMEFFDVLKLEGHYSDARVLKAVLGLLADTLYRDARCNLITQCMHALAHIMADEHTALDCKTLSIVLNSLDDLLSHDGIGTLMLSSGKSFVEALCLKFLDTEWDIRDASIHFVGQLFRDSEKKNKVQFALDYDLPLQVFHRVQDSEPYVRASAIEVLEKMMQCKEGWDYVQRHKVSRDLAGKLPHLLYDTEAFVRRAAIDAIVCLVQYRSCQGMAMEMKESPEHISLCPEIIKKLIQDEDTDVRIRACRLIENLWFLYHHEKAQKKKNPIQEHDIMFFKHIQGGDLLVEAVNDTNRVVRIEAVRVIETILKDQVSDESQSFKRQFVQVESDEEFETEFLNKLRLVNLEQRKQTLDPEHLYQEAFDINADMMTQSIIPTDPEDDINMLDCY